MSALGRLLRHDPLADPEPLVQRVYAYVAYRIGDGPDAEDVTSEAFARAVRYRDSYDPSRGAPIAWVLGIARRCIEDFLRERRHEGEVPDLAAHADVAEETVTRIALWQAAGRLGDRDRELIALRYGADLTARQIARQLAMRTNAVEVALHRALHRLRVLLVETGPEDEQPEEPASGGATVRISSVARYEGVEPPPERRRRR
jgi:RNA polymerase sigma factor (sigma-70 family)